MSETMPEKTPEERLRVTIHIMGRAVRVPFGLTIMKAMEYSGLRLIQGVGCRSGFCGACSTLYRTATDYKLRPALACQTTVEQDMDLAFLPFVPANRASYELEELDPDRTSTLLASFYPELARCVACNTCTKACPQDLSVMEYIQLALRDDYEGVARESFDCIQCGLCAARCPADITQYHVAQLARRVQGHRRVTPSKQLAERVTDIDSERFTPELDRLMAMDQEELQALYAARKIEGVA